MVRDVKKRGRDIKEQRLGFYVFPLCAEVPHGTLVLVKHGWNDTLRKEEGVFYSRLLQQLLVFLYKLYVFILLDGWKGD